MADLASRRGKEKAGAAQNPFWDKGLGHSCGLLASSGQQQQCELNTVPVSWVVTVGTPWSSPHSDNTVLDWEASKTDSWSLPSVTLWVT